MRRPWTSRDVACSSIRAAPISYDYLIIATGSAHAYFGHPEWAARAPGLKTLDDALEIRRQVLLAFEAAERETDPAVQRRLLTFVIVGGGPTGVELAGALAEIARQSLKQDFRNIRPESARIVLIEGSPQLLGAFPERLREAARRSLERLGVEVQTGSIVTGIDDEGVSWRSASSFDERAGRPGQRPAAGPDRAVGGRGRGLADRRVAARRAARSRRTRPGRADPRCAGIADALRVAALDHLTPLEHDRAVAEPLDRAHVAGARARTMAALAMRATVPWHFCGTGIADREQLVDEQDVGVDLSHHRECEPDDIPDE